MATPQANFKVPSWLRTNDRLAKNGDRPAKAMAGEGTGRFDSIARHVMEMAQTRLSETISNCNTFKSVSLTLISQLNK
eukprot:m.52300 g.52300  ORF g.52300 m.52300 type:complete len:78 (-) comp10783_c0_seq6:148-381(-)